ncbi:MAG: class I SAM-dependent methyltransferase [Paracoccaceae bacterium]
MANRYAKSQVSDETTYQKKLKITQNHMTPQMQVLEFGCGTGSTAIVHAAYVNHILAVDSSAAMLDIATAKAADAQIRNISFELSSIEDLKRTDHSFDMVMGHSILHLVDDRDPVIAKSFDLLKPGGTFITSTTCIGKTSRILKALLPVGYALGLLPLVRFFSIDELVQSIVQAGFVVEEQWLPDGSDAVFIIARRPAKE